MAFPVATLDDFARGWFVGHFTPTLIKTHDVEVAIKRYPTVYFEPAHHHRIATEITAIVSGRVRMLDRTFGPGDLVKLDPGTSTSFTCLDDAVTVVVKHPGAPHDKYPD